MWGYSNLSIRAKVISLITLFVFVALADMFFATNRMRYIDETYGQVIDGPESANLAIARANRNLIFIDRSIYRFLVEPGEEGKSAALRDITDTAG